MRARAYTLYHNRLLRNTDAVNEPSPTDARALAGLTSRLCVVRLPWCAARNFSSRLMQCHTWTGSTSSLAAWNTVWSTLRPSQPRPAAQRGCLLDASPSWIADSAHRCEHAAMSESIVVRTSRAGDCHDSCTMVQLCELTADHGTAVRRYLMYSTALWTKARKSVTARTSTVVKCSLAF